MAGDLNYNVSVDTQTAVRNVQNLNNAIGGLGTAFKALAAGASLAAVASFSDSVTNLRNKLMLLSDTQEQAGAQFKALAGIAINSRSDLNAVGDLYFKIARTAKDLGISQQEAATITDSLAKAMSATGASAAESAGPLLQLGQALQSGVFQGDELRSILEGMPTVAKALADQLGVPIGALKKLGADGQITAQDFVKAMRRARDAIEQDFAKTIPTISGAFSQLRTVTALAFNEFEQSSRVGQSFAVSIEYIAFTLYKFSKNIDAVVGPLWEFIKILGALAAFSLAGRVLSGLASAAGGVYSAFVALKTSGQSLMMTFALLWSNLKKISSGFIPIEKAADVLGRRFGFLGQGLSILIKALGSIAAGIGAFLGLDKLGDWFSSLSDKNSDTNKELEGFRKEMAALTGDMNTAAGAPAPKFLDPKIMREARDQLDQIAIAYSRQNAELIKRLGFEQQLIGASDQQRTSRQALFDLENNYLSEVNKLVDQYRIKSQSKVAEDQAQLPMIQEALKRVTDEYAAQIKAVEDLTNQNYLLAEAEKQRLALADFSLRSQLDNTKELRKLQDDMAKMGMTEIQKKYYDIEVAARESARSAIDAENSRRRSLKIAEMTAAEEQKYYAAAARGTEQIKQQSAVLYERSRQFRTGWTDAFRTYVDEATNAAKVGERVFNKALQGMEDMIVNFAKTGKFEWKSFVASMAEELLRSQIKQAFAGIMSAMGESTGVLGSIGKMLGLSGGGAAQRGQSAATPMYVYDVAGGGGAGGGGMFPNMRSGGGIGGGGTGGNILGNVWNGIKSVGSSIGNVVSGIGNAATGIWDTVKNVGSSIFSSIGSIGSSIGDFFGGFFANGGTLGAGKWGIAGEAGPEIISGPATITPMMGGQNVTYNINAVDASSFKALVAADPGFIHAVAMMGAGSVPSRR